MRVFLLEAFYGGNLSDVWAFESPAGAAEWMLRFPQYVFDCRFELTEREVCGGCRQVVVADRQLEVIAKGSLPTPPAMAAAEVPDGA